MPPKAKFSKEEIIKAAVNLVRTEGAQALTVSYTHLDVYKRQALGG